MLIVANPTEHEMRPDGFESLHQADRMIGEVTVIILDCHPRIVSALARSLSLPYAGLDAALRPVIVLESKIGEFGRGERI